MPQKSDPAIVHAGATVLPVDGSVPIARLSDPEFAVVCLAICSTFGAVAVNVPPEPWQTTEITRPPDVVPVTEALIPAAAPAEKLVTGVPSDAPLVTEIDPALWLFASDTATETVLLPVGQVGPIRPYSATPPTVSLADRTNPSNGIVVPP
jgi:hypothetical protein